MSRLTPYANQAATLLRRSGYSSASGPTRASVAILCRYEPYSRQMQAASGEMFTSNARVYTVTPVAMGDAITYGSVTYPVRTVKAHPGLDGAIDHYEVVV
jgi:hypothetical protein